MAKKREIYALVTTRGENDWSGHYFMWADSETREWRFKFKTLDEAIADIPSGIKKIKIEYIDDNGNEIRDVINR